MIKSELTIIDPKPPLLNRIVVSLVFTVFFAYVRYLVNIKIEVQRIDAIAVIVYMLWILGVIITMTAGSISRHGIQFNFKEMKIRHTYDIGTYRYKEKWQDLIDLDYLSIYREGGNYNIIMWYQENKFLNLFSMSEYEEIVNKACMLSDYLKINVLDATINDELNHWINKELYRATGEIKHYND